VGIGYIRYLIGKNAPRQEIVWYLANRKFAKIIFLLFIAGKK
jgi:hypothetical protein